MSPAASGRCIGRSTRPSPRRGRRPSGSSRTGRDQRRTRPAPSSPPHPLDEPNVLAAAVPEWAKYPVPAVLTDGKYCCLPVSVLGPSPSFERRCGSGTPTNAMCAHVPHRPVARDLAGVRDRVSALHRTHSVSGFEPCPATVRPRRPAKRSRPIRHALRRSPLSRAATSRTPKPQPNDHQRHRRPPAPQPTSRPPNRRDSDTSSRFFRRDAPEPALSGNPSPMWWLYRLFGDSADQALVIALTGTSPPRVANASDAGSIAPSATGSQPAGPDRPDRSPPVRDPPRQLGACAEPGGGWPRGVRPVRQADRAGYAVGSRACRRQPESVPRSRTSQVQQRCSSGEEAPTPPRRL